MINETFHAYQISAKIFRCQNYKLQLIQISGMFLFFESWLLRQSLCRQTSQQADD